MAHDTQHDPHDRRIRKTLLIADDAAHTLSGYAQALHAAGYDVVSHSAGAALPQVPVAHLSAVLLAPHFAAADGPAATLLHHLPPHVPVVVLSQPLARPTLTYLQAPGGATAQASDIIAALSDALWPDSGAGLGQHLVASTSALTAPGFGLAHEFDLALASLFMAYQPIVDCAHSTLFGYEALVRCAPGNLASPPALLAAAESLGRLQELSRQIRAQVAANLGAAPAHVSGQKIFVNLHAQDLLDPALFDADAPLSAHAHRIVLEITERTPLEEIPDVLPRIAKLRALGYRIALDDLGAGYAGLSTFAQLEPEVVKLDMALVRQVEKSRTKRHIIVAVVQLCEKLGIHVIAEGIETIAERDVLMALGCQVLQGYYFGRPHKEFGKPTY